jgi:hypothetical protein
VKPKAINHYYIEYEKSNERFANKSFFSFKYPSGENNQFKTFPYFQSIKILKEYLLISKGKITKLANYTERFEVRF